MAGKNTIQVLRGKITETNKGEKLLEGQPFYNEDKNYLTIGRQGGTASLDSLPITVRELVGYVSDSDKITNTKTNEYSLKYSNTDNSLKITSPTGININSGNSDTSNITINRGNASKIVLGKSNIELTTNSLTVTPNSGNVATINTSATNGFILKDNGGSNLATVEMGKLKLNSLYDADTEAEQASISGAGIEVKKNLKVNNILTPKYIGTTQRKLNFSYDGGTNGALHINTESPLSAKINKFVFFAGDGDTEGQASGNSPKADIVVNKVWTTAIDTNSAVVNKTLEVKERTSLKQDLDVTGATLSRGDLLFKSNLAFREDGNTDRIIIEKVTSRNIIYLDLKNIRNIKADNTIEAQSFDAKSDKRLKENIEKYSPKQSVLNLPVYSYNFIKDTDKTQHIGCLAQDLQKICPEIVHEGEDGFLSIEENKLVYLLLEEVKKLKKRVDELEAR